MKVVEWKENMVTCIKTFFKKMDSTESGTSCLWNRSANDACCLGLLVGTFFVLAAIISWLIQQFIQIDLIERVKDVFIFTEAYLEKHAEPLSYLLRSWETAE